MTPYIHQMYYPIHDNLNVIQLNENEIDEFENLKKIPIVRSNRRKDFNNEDEQADDRGETKQTARKKPNRKGRVANLDFRILNVVGSNLGHTVSKTIIHPKVLSNISQHSHHSQI